MSSTPLATLRFMSLLNRKYWDHTTSFGRRLQASHESTAKACRASMAGGLAFMPPGTNSGTSSSSVADRLKLHHFSPT
eukprot:201289-Amphidinium_carterae.1